jgi:FdhD protein
MIETSVRRVNGGPIGEESDDILAVEEPLEIRLGFRENGKRVHRPISITMRTPGDDLSLAAGFLFTEGILTSPDQIANIRHCGRGRNPGSSEGAPPPATNTIIVDLADGVAVDLKRLERHFYTTSSCGVCGKRSIDALATVTERVNGDLRLSPSIIHGMPDVMRASQSAFDTTGGLHASALFDADGNLELLSEDVGRHNALDKVIGRKFVEGKVPLSEMLLVVSGRASFELVQKALMAGIPVLAAVGAPSSLAVQLAREFGMTLIGFVRDGRFNIYTGESRIIPQVHV